MMNDYENREIMRFRHECDALQRAPLRDRKEAARDWAEAISGDLTSVGENIDNMLYGNCGHGAYLVARDIVTRPSRLNKVAILGQMIAAVAYQCPAREARAEWNKLSISAQRRLNESIQETIDEHLRRFREGEW